MEENSHIGVEQLKAGVLVFFTLILIIVFMALYVRSHVLHSVDIPEEVAAENLALPGKIYTRR